MKLRNFLYIDGPLLDDYIAAIDGYIYEEETLKLNETSQKAAAAKFDKLYKFLSSDEDSPLKYFEDFANPYRDDFIEVLVVPRFSNQFTCRPS